MRTILPLKVYETYLALKLHFTIDKYDFFKYNGSVKSATETSLNKRRDKFFFTKVGKKFNDVADMTQYMVASFVYEDKAPWIGFFVTTEADAHYTKFKKTIESLEYLFSEECGKVFTNKKDFNIQFHCIDGQHPLILKEYLQGNISIETFIVLDKVFGIFDYFDMHITDKIVWPSARRKCQRYAAFLDIEPNKYKGILKGKIT